MTPAVCACRCSATSRSWRQVRACPGDPRPAAGRVQDRVVDRAEGRLLHQPRRASGTAKRTVALARTRGSPSRRPGRRSRIEKTRKTRTFALHRPSRRLRISARPSTAGHPVRCWRPPSRCCDEQLSTPIHPATNVRELTTAAACRRTDTHRRVRRWLSGLLTWRSTKYRPATFAEVVGQEHVTEPLCTALAAWPDQPRLPVLRSTRLR